MSDSSPDSGLLLPYPHYGAFPTLRDKAVASRVFGTKELTAPTAQQYLKVLRPLCELCAEKGITAIPKVMIAKSPVQNASMTADGTMLISEGLNETLSETEMRAVIMHELEHYKKKEITSVFGHSLGFIADLAVGWFAGNKLESALHRKITNPYIRSYASHAIPAIGTHYLVVAPAHAFFQRKSEYEADLEGAKTVGFDNMIGVLKYFDELYANRYEKIPSNTVKRIMDKGVIGNITNVIFPFDDHPTFKDRIAHLERERSKQPATQVSQIKTDQPILIAPSTPTLH